MKRARIFRVGQLPQIIIRDDNQKIRIVVLECFEPNQVNNYLNTYHIIAKILFNKSIQYVLDKKSNKCKMMVQNNVNILEELVKYKIGTIIEGTNHQTKLYKDEELKKLKTLTPEKDINPNWKITNAVNDSQQLKKLKIKQEKEYNLQFLSTEIILSEGSNYFGINLRNINTAFQLIDHEALYQFIDKNQEIQLRNLSLEFDLTRNIYKIYAQLQPQLQRQILQNGWGELSDTAEIQLQREQYKEYTQLVISAKEKFKGIWKMSLDIFKIIYSKKIRGIIIQVLEGHIFKIKVFQTNKIIEFQLNRINCPTNQELGAFQCRQFSRKLLIGQQIIALVQIDTKLKLLGILIKMHTLQNVEYLLIENGLGRIKKQYSHLNDGDFLQLNKIQRSSLNKKVGLYSNQIGIYRFENLTQLNSKEMIQRAEQFFARVVNRDKQFKFQGVIEKFKSNDVIIIRLLHYNAVINLKLYSVSSLKSKVDVDQLKKFKQLSEQYVYLNYIQRDVQITLYSFDKEHYCGSVFINKINNISEKLLLEGLVYSDSPINPEYQKWEQIAKKNKKGIWALKISNLIEKKVKIVQKFKGSISWVNDQANTVFYQRRDDLGVLEELIQPVLIPSRLKLADPNTLKIGNIYAAFYDGSLYRAKLLYIKKQTVCRVRYIDYGNEGDAQKNRLYNIPQHLMIEKQVAHKAVLKYLKEHTKSNKIHKMALDKISNLLMDKQFMIELTPLNNEVNQIMIYGIKEQSINTSMNLRLLKDGLLKLNKDNLNNEQIQIQKVLYDGEKEARNKQKGIWER